VKGGRGFVPAISMPGETFGGEGLEADGRYVTDARADEESETLHLSGTRFRAFLREQPQHALAVIGQVMAERSCLLEKLRELATLSVEERLITTLVRMSQSRVFTEADGRVVLGATQYRLLCELVGATRESVSLVLNRLIASGLAERNGMTYTIPSVPALASRLGPSWIDTEVGFPLSQEMPEQAH
jgi:CRP-like cAMP-binding protein